MQLLNSKTIHKKSCPACSSEFSKSDRSLKIRDYHYRVCSYCKSYILDPLPTPEDTEKIYKEPSYFFEIYGDYFSLKSSYKNFWKWFSHVEKHLPNKNCRMAEIGSGSGAFLQVLKDYGYVNFRGYEMNEVAVLECRKKGLPVYRQEEFSSEYDLDAVFMFDIIEHVSNPKEFLRITYDRLRPGGLLILETSCNRRFFSRLLGRFWWFLIPPNHVIVYNINSLEGLLSNLKFKIIKSIKIDYHWISIQNAFVKINNRFPCNLDKIESLNKDIIFPFCHFTSFLSIVNK